ncbi:MAG: molybdenum cofactor biosynthesis protein MoaE [Gemmatimonadales bacterium]
MDVLTREPIDLATLVNAVESPERGAVATFLGMVRNHHNGRAVLELEYTAYEPMATERLRAILSEAEGLWSVRVAASHRLGLLSAGDVAVGVAVASEHRNDAFVACRFVIEEIKSRLPVWKRERYDDGGEVWVDPTSASGAYPVLSQPREA